MHRRQFLRFAAGGIALATLPLPACVNSGPPLVEGNAGPLAIAADGTRYELVSDRHHLLVTTPDGRTQKVGRLGRAPGELNYPAAITLSGNLAYVADLGNHRVQAFDETGTCVSVLAADALFHPSGITARGKRLYVASRTGLVELAPTGELVQTLASDTVMMPRSLAMLDDHLLVVDAGHRQIVELRSDGSLVRRFEGDWIVPSAVAASGDTIYVADSARAELVMFDRKARRIDTLPLATAPRHLTFAADGQLYVT